ncbi:solute carrier family 23 protein [Pseudonocardia sp. ICBG601]|uniref:solute carrier family 23 protein n=1 Tax=Pseudonocardia sp. ICBG601 TaxID=2846759 RepID=UPI001CF6D6E7|nr:solute carrier family 23 protein [Pseudonocardia sp. ICBG601]
MPTTMEHPSRVDHPDTPTISKHALSRLAVLLGIVAGAVVAAVAGRITPPAPGPLLALPEPFPFGAPELLLPAMVPLLLFSIGAMAEAAGQTMLTAEAVDRPVGRHDVTRTVRGDGVTSVLAGLLGGPLMVTSGENIGIVRLSRVRSRYVTVGTAVLLVVLSVCAPVARWVAAVPSAVVGAAGVVVFAMVAALGVGMVARSGLGDDRALMTATLALAAGPDADGLPGAPGHTAARPGQRRDDGRAGRGPGPPTAASHGATAGDAAGGAGGATDGATTGRVSGGVTRPDGAPHGTSPPAFRSGSGPGPFRGTGPPRPVPRCRPGTAAPHGR